MHLYQLRNSQKWLWPIYFRSLDPVASPERPFGQNTLDRETKRNTQLNKFADLSHDAFNKHLDRMVDERDSDTYTSRVRVLSSARFKKKR